MQDHKLPLLFKQILRGQEKILNYIIDDPSYLITAYCMHYMDCGIKTLPSKNTILPPLFFPNPLLNLHIVQAPFFGQILPIYWFLRPPAPLPLTSDFSVNPQKIKIFHS